MDWASPLWNLVYLAATLVMLGFAYYSRHEYVQKLALLVFASFIGFHIFNETPYESGANYWIDAIGMAYAAYLLHRSEWREVTAMGVFIISWLDIVLHIKWGHGGLIHAIAYNLLYVGQLALLSIYGKHYGAQARSTETPRTDPFYRFLKHANSRH